MKKVVAPFSWFGGKRRWSDEVWKRLGDPEVYIEPFAGSLALLLTRPKQGKIEIASDTDAMVCNFFRSVTKNPKEVALSASRPTNEIELVAWHKRLKTERAGLLEELVNDVEYHDPKLAGIWAWGQSNWITNFSVNKSEKNVFRRIRPEGLALSRIKWPVPQCSGETPIEAWINALSQRLAEVRFYARDWNELTRIALHDANRNKITAVVLDPPYIRKDQFYNKNENSSAKDSYEFAISHGERFRIVYFCENGEFPCPDGWSLVSKSYPSNGTKNKELGKLDEAFFSPACLNSRT